MKLIKLLFAVITLLVITNVTLTNRSVDESLVVADLSRDITSLQKENTILKAQVASLGSLGTIREKIAEAGFTAAPKVASITTSSSVASR